MRTCIVWRSKISRKKSMVTPSRTGRVINLSNHSCRGRVINLSNWSAWKVLTKSRDCYRQPKKGLPEKLWQALSLVLAVVVILLAMIICRCCVKARLIGWWIITRWAQRNRAEHHLKRCFLRIVRPEVAEVIVGSLDWTTIWNMIKVKSALGIIMYKPVKQWIKDPWVGWFLVSNGRGLKGGILARKIMMKR